MPTTYTLYRECSFGKAIAVQCELTDEEATLIGDTDSLEIIQQEVERTRYRTDMWENMRLQALARRARTHEWLAARGVTGPVGEDLAERLSGTVGEDFL